MSALGMVAALVTWTLIGGVLAWAFFSGADQ